jgi:hypothetical protein
LPQWSRCLAHLDADDLEQAIKLAKTEGLDARGVTVTPALLDRAGDDTPEGDGAG